MSVPPANRGTENASSRYLPRGVEAPNRAAEMTSRIQKCRMNDPSTLELFQQKNFSSPLALPPLPPPRFLQVDSAHDNLIHRFVVDGRMFVVLMGNTTGTIEELSHTR